MRLCWGTRISLLVKNTKEAKPQWSLPKVRTVLRTSSDHACAVDAPAFTNRGDFRVETSCFGSAAQQLWKAS